MYNQNVITSIAWWYDQFDPLFALKQSNDNSHFDDILVQQLSEALLKKLDWFIESGLAEDQFHQCINHQNVINSIAWWYDWFDSLFALKQSKDDFHFSWQTSSTTAWSIFEETGLIYWTWACWGSVSSMQ